MVAYERNGLLVTEMSGDERAIRHALKQLDDQLILDRDVDEEHGVWVWKVHRRVGGDRPPLPVCSWRDTYGNPLPLTGGLIEEVKRLREQDTSRLVDLHNAKMKADEQARLESELIEAARGALPVVEGKRRHFVKPSPALALTRRRMRRQGIET